MVPADALPLLAETTIAGSAAIMVVLTVRKRLRRYFGARIAYASWSLVPAALAAVLLPAATVVTQMAVMSQPVAALPVAVTHGPATTIGAATAAMLAWAIGVLFSIAWFALQQRRFRRALGTLQSRGDGLQQSSAVRGLPAAFGLLHPRIVVPADFDQRFSTEQQQLMHAHERSHIRTGDLHLNAAVVVLRCLFWFNPLVHLASRRFRHDQELACDQRVVALHPKSRRAYGEAMLKAQLASQALPLGCHWGYGHPLKERIAMLNQPVPSRKYRAIGSVMMAGLILLAGTTAWAMQPSRLAEISSDGSQVGIRAEGTLQIEGGEPRHFTVINEAAKPFSLRIEQGGQSWELVATATPRDDNMIDLHTRLLRDGVLVGQPQLRAHEGEPAVLRHNDGVDVTPGFELGITLTHGTLASMLPPPSTPTPSSPPPTALPVLPPPAYPKAAAEQKITGKVVLVIDVDAGGNPVDIVVESSEPTGVFDQAAVDAARQWKFNPEIEDGKPVASRVRVPVDFEIPSGEGGAETAPGIDLLALSGAEQVAEASCDTIAGNVESGALVCL